MITKVGYSQHDGSLGNLVLKGHSPTIFLDAAPHTQSFGGGQTVNTSIIADEIIKQGLDELYEYRVETKYMGSIDFSAQYNETHYNYLSRIAEAYGEQFFYDGEVLHFGSLPSVGTPIKLTYGSTVTDISIETNAVHTKQEFFSYNSSRNEKLTASDVHIRHLGDLAQRSYRSNEDIFKTKSLTPSPINDGMYKDITDSQRSTQGSAAVKVMTVSGNTTIPFLFPGCSVDLEMRKLESNLTSYFTKLMITETTHEIDGRGYYKGTFNSIAEGTGFLPKPNFTVPKAEQQIATVISNVDPLNQGRVQVRFDWQLNDTTNWIRVMSPDAGGTDVITQNRGYVAIPEIGDQVMVGFEYHHPDFPFVMGGMFHGKIGLGGGIQNHMRSIQTKSGIKVLMNDNEKSVTILDPSGKTYFMDGNGNITVTAPKNITFNAGDDINIIAGKNLNTNVCDNANTNIGKNNSINIKENYDFHSNNYQQNINQNKNVNVSGDLEEISATAILKAISGDILIQSAGISTVLGAIDAKVNKG